MKLKKVLHHTFFGFTAYMAFAIAVGTVISTDFVSVLAEFTIVPPFLVYLAGITVFLLACGMIITYEHRTASGIYSGYRWKAVHLKPAFCFLVILLAGCSLFYLFQDLSIFHTSTTEERNTRQTEVTINFLVLLLGPFFLWILFLKNLVFGGHNNWRQLLVDFIKTDVSVYLLFRAVIFLVSLAGSILMPSQSGGMQNTYFLFVLDDAQVQSLATGALVSGSSFFSGVTEAASFFVLVTMAKEFLSGSTRNNLHIRLRRMFLELDTFKLLIMTLSCLLIGILTGGDKDNFFATLITLPLFVLWIISGLLFLADTQVLPYMIIFASMGFIERILPIPELTGMAAAIIPGIVGLRIILFAGVALLIANYQRHRQANIGTQVTHNGRPTFSYILWNATFLDLFCFILRIGEKGLLAFTKLGGPGKEEAELIEWVTLAKVADAYINRFLNKITNALDSTK